MLRNGGMDAWTMLILWTTNKRETLRIKILKIKFRIAKLRNESNWLTPQTLKLI